MPGGQTDRAYALSPDDYSNRLHHRNACDLLLEIVRESGQFNAVHRHASSFCWRGQAHAAVNGPHHIVTPALHGDTVVVTWDHQGPSFIVALDKNTGKEIWRKDRDEVDTWATPLVVEHNGVTQVITAGTNRVRSYNLASGELLWEGAGLTMNPIPSPVFADGVVYLMSGYRGNALRAIRLADAKGDVTGTSAVLWEHNRDTPYVPSPLLYENNLYFLKSNSAILTTLDARTGQPLYGPLRLEGLSEVYASPVGAAGRVYLLGRDGNALVIENSPEFKILARNALDDGFDASPAIVGEEMYLRGYRSLYKIAAN